MDSRGTLYFIDRFEEDVAVCERADGSAVRFPRGDLPRDAREGSALRQSENGALALDPQVEQERRQKLFRMQRDLFR
ncbi:MAG: DUF3006 domain-containing protein [Oscillospiraceae bacterium]|jgi:hypothetical protein|nr:DUF3006 domain-containing protein [Oscillospiraceae bacterium]